MNRLPTGELARAIREHVSLDKLAETMHEVIANPHASKRDRCDAERLLRQIEAHQRASKRGQS